MNEDLMQLLRAATKPAVGEAHGDGWSHEEMSFVEQHFDKHSESAFRAQAIWHFHVPGTYGVWVIRAMDGRRWLALGGQQPEWKRMPGRSKDGVVS